MFFIQMVWPSWDLSWMPIMFSKVSPLWLCRNSTSPSPEWPGTSVELLACSSSFLEGLLEFVVPSCSPAFSLGPWGAPTHTSVIPLPLVPFPTNSRFFSCSELQYLPLQVMEIRPLCLGSTSLCCSLECVHGLKARVHWGSFRVFPFSLGLPPSVSCCPMLEIIGFIDGVQFHSSPRFRLGLIWVTLSGLEANSEFWEKQSSF